MKLPPDQYRTVLEQMPILCVDGILVNQQGQILLVKRRNAPFRDEWWVPGGRVLKGETLEQAFRRKMKEELGIDVKILMAVGYYEGHHAESAWQVSGGVHAVSVVFCAVPLSLDITLDDQSSSWAFFDELPTAFKSMKRFTLWL